MGEILIIAVVALLFLGPEKLPGAAKSLSKGIRDLRRHTKELQKTIEDDTQVGDAIRDLKSALRGENLDPYVPPHVKDDGQDSQDSQNNVDASGGESPTTHKATAESGPASGEVGEADEGGGIEAPPAYTYGNDSEADVPLIRPARETVATDTGHKEPTPGVAGASPDAPPTASDDEAHG